MVPPCSDRISRVPPYSRTMICIACTGLSPAKARLSRRFHFSHHCHWPDPRSLATTSGVSFDILSCGYLDVSVPRVRLLSLFYSKTRYPHVDYRKSEAGRQSLPTSQLRQSRVGFPIRKSPDQSLFAAPRSISQRITSFIACACQGIH